MDTKWTKFKESSFTKTICIIIACLLLIGACSNGLKVARHLYCFGNLESGNTFFDSRGFEYLCWHDIQAINEAVTYNKYTSDTATERERGAEEFLAKYKEYKEKYDEYQRLSADDRVDEYSDNEYETTATEYYYSNSFQADISVNINNSTYTVTSFVNCDDNLTDDEIKNQFIYDFNDHIAGPVTSPEQLKQQNIKNMLYYAAADDGTVVTNAENKEEVLAKATSNNKYLFYENGKITDNVNGIIYNSFNDTKKDGTNIYIVIDTAFSQNDHYKELIDKFDAISQLDVEKYVTKTIFFCLLALLFFILTLCLAGHKKGGIQTAPIDKIPYDIHLIATGGLVTLGVMGFITYLYAYLSTYYSGYPDYIPDVPKFIFTKPWYPLISYALVIITYLLTAEFFTSLARGIKAKANIFKNTFIYIFLRFIFKTAVKILKGIKNIIKSIVYKPKHFSRKTIAIIVLYTLFNILAVLLVFFFIGGIQTPLSVIFALLLALGVLALDGYVVYLVVKYLKSLDGIITAVENGEPLAESNEKLPNSLEILAKSYDIANANLQSAIIKAVKDERTKAELITNVSHDLKTPLTSVINYIDLLQKCNIEDETAQEYMGVIAEKSNKLKRLIEDLIEASKISSGNVTINKTKLNLNELAAQAIVEETAEFEKRDLQLIFEEPANRHLAFADGTKIYRVFENLLSNAKKYSAPGSRVYSRLYDDGNYECFEIKNISKEQLNISAEELTERFVRGDKSRNEDGNGLGLSIATELCRLNNGVLEITIDGDLFKATVKIPKE